MIKEELKDLVLKLLTKTGYKDYLVRLAREYRHNDTPEDYNKALKIYYFLIQLNDSSAMNDLGYMYLEEKYFPYNPKIAFFWFSKASMLGNKTALSNIGVMHYEGLLGKKNKKVAEECYKIAAGSSNVAAMYNLGVMNLDNKNYPVAYYWFLKASELKDYSAYLNLLYMKSHNLIDISDTKLDELSMNFSELNEIERGLSKKH